MKHFRWLNTYEHGLWVSQSNRPEPKEINVFLDTSTQLRLVNINHWLRGLNTGFDALSDGYVQNVEIAFSNFDFGEDEDEPSEWDVEIPHLILSANSYPILSFHTSKNVYYQLSLDPEFLVTEPE